jgi:hypothetical protein
MDGFVWRTAHRLGTGSKAVSTWCWQQSPIGTLAAAGTAVALPVYEPASTLIIPAFAWGIAAWANGTPAPEAEHDDADEDETEEPVHGDENEPDVNEPRDRTPGEKPRLRDPDKAMRDYIEHAVAANRHHRNRQGVHIRELLEGLQHHGALTGWKPEDLRRHLEALEIPVRDGIGIIIDGKKYNRPGVHHDDLSKALGRAPVLPPHLVPDRTPVEA